MSDKVYTQAELVKELAKRREHGSRIVFTNGCFDLLHVGHIRYLQAARRFGDLLVVGVNSDASVRTLDKGDRRPLVPEGQRAEVVAALACVDYVVLFDEPDPKSLIAAIQPDVLAKGGDWKPDEVIGRDIVERRGGTLRIIPLVPDVSTTTLLRKIRGSERE